MKILHTADIHLREKDDERWEALEEIIRLGNEENIDILTIAGDLFDKRIDSETLHPAVSDIFSNNSFDIVILPGNHDQESYRTKINFGRDVKIIRDINQPLSMDNINIFGLPFSDKERKDIITEIRSIRNKTQEAKINILLFHGELLDKSFSSEDFGEEGSRYMGVKLEYFEDLNLDYVLAGHFHSRFNVYDLSDGGYFIYPGSPVSITKKEDGRRAVCIFETGQEPEQKLLETSYFERIEMRISPQNEDNFIEKLKDRLNDLPDCAKIILNVTGYTSMDENEILADIDEMAEEFDVREINRYIRGISYILEDELFRIFTRKLDDTDYERKDEIRELVINGLDRVLE